MRYVRRQAGAVSEKQERRETGLEPATACLEGILLYTVWHERTIGPRRLSSYLLVKRPEVSHGTYFCDRLGLKGWEGQGKNRSSRRGHHRRTHWPAIETEA
jgi:hypothetical protein